VLDVSAAILVITLVWRFALSPADRQLLPLGRSAKSG